MAEKIRYWGYRIAKDRIPFFWEELRQGRLRQGWGADRGQNLRNLTVDKGARLNLPMLRVKRGRHPLGSPAARMGTGSHR